MKKGIHLRLFKSFYFNNLNKQYFYIYKNTKKKICILNPNKLIFIKSY